MGDQRETRRNDYPKLQISFYHNDPNLGVPILKEPHLKSKTSQFPLSRKLILLMFSQRLLKIAFNFDPNSTIE